MTGRKKRALQVPSFVPYKAFPMALYGTTVGTWSAHVFHPVMLDVWIGCYIFPACSTSLVALSDSNAISIRISAVSKYIMSMNRACINLVPQKKKKKIGHSQPNVTWTYCKIFPTDPHTGQYWFWVTCDTRATSESTVAFLLHLIELNLTQQKCEVWTTLNPFTPKSDLIDFTLSNARWFYSSKGDPLGVKG